MGFYKNKLLIRYEEGVSVFPICLIIYTAGKAGVVGGFFFHS